MQARQGDPLAAISAGAVGPAFKSMQGGFNLSHFVDVALLLGTFPVRTQVLRGLVFAVGDLARTAVAKLPLSLLVSMQLSTQLQPPIGQTTAQFFQLSLCCETHHGWV